MHHDEIDVMITGGTTSIDNCFSFKGCVYCYNPESNEFVWVSEHDESKLSAMLRRLAQLGLSFDRESDLMVALQRHPTLSNHLQTLTRFLFGRAG
jgi:hypothetical protein